MILTILLSVIISNALTFSILNYMNKRALKQLEKEYNLQQDARNSTLAMVQAEMVRQVQGLENTEETIVNNKVDKKLLH